MTISIKKAAIIIGLMAVNALTACQKKEPKDKTALLQTIQTHPDRMVDVNDDFWGYTMSANGDTVIVRGQIGYRKTPDGQVHTRIPLAYTRPGVKKSYATEAAIVMHDLNKNTEQVIISSMFNDQSSDISRSGTLVLTKTTNNNGVCFEQTSGDLEKSKVSFEKLTATQKQMAFNAIGLVEDVKKAAERKIRDNPKL